MNSPDTWQWVWLVATATFLMGEMATPGSFFLLPFAVGAGTATVMAFLDVPVGLEWLAFLTVSVGVFAALRPLARRLDRELPAEGVGAKRLIGSVGRVIEEIPSGPDGVGLVRVEAEEWRATSAEGRPIPAEAEVKVVDVKGTRVVVHPVTRREPVE